MYQQSPLCYLASIEQMYIQALMASDDSVDDQTQRKRSIVVRQALSDTPSSQKSKRDDSEEDIYAFMFEDALPWHISYLHLVEPSVVSATAVVVSTTSCAGLDGINGGTGVVTSFRKYEVAQTPPPTTVNNDDSPGTVYATSTASGRLMPRGLLMLVVLVLLGRCV
jgi:hypothetical protein